MKAVNPLKFVAAGALALACASVQANESPKFYAGVGYSHGTLDTYAEFELPMTMFHLGVALSPNLKIEARYGINAGDYVHDTSDAIAHYSETYEVASYFAGLAKAIIPVNEKISVYGMAGYNKLTLDYSGEAYIYSLAQYINVYEEYSDSGLTYGAGIELNVGESLSLTGEYQVMFEDVSGINVGLSYRF